MASNKKNLLGGFLGEKSKRPDRKRGFTKIYKWNGISFIELKSFLSHSI